jgi:hypothetical protein
MVPRIRASRSSRIWIISSTRPISSGFSPLFAPIKPGRTKIEIALSAAHGLMGGDAYRIKPRKFGTHWVVVECRMTLIS